MNLLLVLYPLLLGLLIGSYLNVVVYRLPRGLSTVRPPSACPGCDTRIRPLDNIPVLSFVLLRGSCRHCGRSIGWRYPIVELLTAALFLACALVFGLTPEGIIAAAFCCLLTVLALIDLDHLILPDRLTLPGVAAGVLVTAADFALERTGTLTEPLWHRATLVESALGAALGAGVILGINGLWWVLRRVQGFGLGDAKMLAMVGAFLGPAGIAVTLFFATLGGSLVGLYLIARKRIGLKGKLPFGSFLALGAASALFFGPALLDWYLNLYR